ncbi:hypothetical protein Q5752_002745 [Cryptotrichosporon argae]
MSAPAPRLKLVVRRLPPTLPEQTFWAAVAPFVEGKSGWRRYVSGRPGDAYGAHPVHSRAYVLMNDADSLLAFHRGFDGHVFRSKAGGEFQAVVEFAPVQKTPVKAKTKADARMGTIDDDPDYLSFLESLNGSGPSKAAEIALGSATPAPAPAVPTSTPLLDHLRSKKAAKGGDKAASASKKGGQAQAQAPGGAAKDGADKDAGKADKGGKQGKGKRKQDKDKAKASNQPPAVVMVAGKGREVMIVPATMAGTAPSASEEGGAGDASKKKAKSRKKAAKDGAEPSRPEGRIVLDPDGKASPADGGAVAAAAVPDRGGPSERGGRGGGRGRGGRGEAKRGRGAAGAGGAGVVVADGGDADRAGPHAPTAKDRPARGTVVSILSRGADGVAGRGRGRGGAPGLAGGGAAAGRIDD